MSERLDFIKVCSDIACSKYCLSDISVLLIFLKMDFFHIHTDVVLFNKEKNSIFYPNTCQYLVKKKIQFNLRIYSGENVLISRQVFLVGLISLKVNNACFFLFFLTTDTFMFKYKKQFKKIDQSIFWPYHFYKTGFIITIFL